MYEKICTIWQYGYFVIAFILFIIFSSGGDGIWVGNMIMSILWAMPITLTLFFVTILLGSLFELFPSKYD